MVATLCVAERRAFQYAFQRRALERGCVVVFHVKCVAPFYVRREGLIFSLPLIVLLGFVAQWI